MPKVKVAKSKRPEAERASEHALVELFHCVSTRRALRTKFAKVDFFACDTIGVEESGKRHWIQVTAGQTAAVLTRRKKIEKHPWHVSDTVAVWQLTFRVSIINSRQKEWFFKVWDFQVQPDGTRAWVVLDSPIEVPKRWFKAL